MSVEGREAASLPLLTDPPRGPTDTDSALPARGLACAAAELVWVEDAGLAAPQLDQAALLGVSEHRVDGRA